MSIMYKYHLNLVPQYLSDFANIYRKDNSRYSTRYEDNYMYLLELFKYVT